MARSDPSLALREASVVLRAALVRGGRIVHERRVKAGALGVIVRGVEALLVTDPEGALAVFDATDRTLEGDVRGRIVRDGGVPEAIDGPRALSRGDRGRLDLPHGWILLFELSEHVPAAAPRPRLPLLRAPLVDGPFTAMAMGSLMLHAAFVLVLEHMDPPYVHALVPTRTAELLMDIPETPIAPIEVPTPTTEGPSDSPTTEGHDEVRTADARPSTRRGPVRPVEAPDVARLGEELDRILGPSVLGTLSVGAGPSAGDVLATAEGVPSLSAAAPVLAPRGGGDRVIADHFGELQAVGTEAGPRAEGPALAATGPVGTVRPPECGADGAICWEPSPGRFDARIVVRAVGRLRGAMTRCYEHHLHGGDPDLRGSVDVTFDIEESGEVTGVRAAENTTGSPELATCLVRVLSRIPRFHPGPEGGSVSFRFPIVLEPAE